MPGERNINFEKIIKSKIEDIRKVIHNDSLFPEYLMRDDLKDEADIAEGSVQNEMNIEFNARKRKYITALEMALARLKSDSFGICIECEEPISEKRLMAKPESTLCFDCQDKMEKSNSFRKKH
jgi:DnaK suppressor protein